MQLILLALSAFSITVAWRKRRMCVGYHALCAPPRILVAKDPAQQPGEPPIRQGVVNEDGQRHVVRAATGHVIARGHQREAHAIRANDEEPWRADRRSDLSRRGRTCGDHLHERERNTEDAALETHPTTGRAPR